MTALAFAILASPLALILAIAARAPLGWEDADGWHAGAADVVDNLCFSHEGALQHDR